MVLFNKLNVSVLWSKVAMMVILSELNKDVKKSIGKVWLYKKNNVSLQSNVVRNDHLDSK